ncbi:uncharacterized protein [Narcine bancroftii]|uniref:uncharacterized protein isoform X6 n=1 Tax=Narcine bancroftii TaxID=1343680 RepID=UPI0038310179
MLVLSNEKLEEDEKVEDMDSPTKHRYFSDANYGWCVKILAVIACVGHVSLDDEESGHLRRYSMRWDLSNISSCSMPKKFQNSTISLCPLPRKKKRHISHSTYTSSSGTNATELGLPNLNSTMIENSTEGSGHIQPDFGELSSIFNPDSLDDIDISEDILLDQYLCPSIAVCDMSAGSLEMMPDSLDERQFSHSACFMNAHSLEMTPDSLDEQQFSHAKRDMSADSLDMSADSLNEPRNVYPSPPIDTFGARISSFCTKRDMSADSLDEPGFFISHIPRDGIEAQISPLPNVYPLPVAPLRLPDSTF